MNSTHHPEQRFASFVLDREKASELAINAESVLEATTVSDVIHPLPTGVDHLEGFMRLREDTIPVINLKKRLGLANTDYGTEAKVAVVGMSGFRFGLLFDDIKDVLMVPDACIHPIHPALLTEMSLITNLIKLDNGRRTLQLLDLKRLFGDEAAIRQFRDLSPDATGGAVARARAFSRFVVFCIGQQHYGVPVERAQEITFLTEIDQTFKNECIEGALDLRGHAIPVINAVRLLQQREKAYTVDADTRVLVLNADEFQYGMIVDRISEIIRVADDEIMHLPQTGNQSVSGVYQQADGNNIMLLQVDALISEQQACMRSVARLKARVDDPSASTIARAETRHLITAECYLVFSIGRNFAVELNDVQEIIEPADLMDIPGAAGVDRRVLNLRGSVIPVVNLRHFYGFEAEDGTADNPKLIIAKHDNHIVALEVDQIITIYKQVQYQKTPSLNPRFSGKQDTLDRLIEFIGESGINEHVLVINVGAIMHNHLGLPSSTQQTTQHDIAKEKLA